MEKPEQIFWATQFFLHQLCSKDHARAGDARVSKTTVGGLGSMELTILRAESRTLQPSHSLPLAWWKEGPWAACVLRE